jgi:hypothetical protein
MTLGEKLGRIVEHRAVLCATALAVAVGGCDSILGLGDLTVADAGADATADSGNADATPDRIGTGDSSIDQQTNDQQVDVREAGSEECRPCVVNQTSVGACCVQ